MCLRAALWMARARLLLGFPSRWGGKHLDGEQLREESACLAPVVQSVTEANQSRSWEAETTRERVLLTGLLPGLCSTFLVQPRPACLQMEPPTAGWTPVHQFSIKKVTTDLFAGHFHGGSSSVEVSSPQVYLVDNHDWPSQKHNGTISQKAQ